MKEQPPYAVVLVFSTSHALKAERVVKKAGYACKLIPVPRHLSSDCGICLLIPQPASATINELLADNRVEVDAIHAI